MAEIPNTQVQRPRFVRFMDLVKSFWTGADRTAAWLLALVLLVMVLLGVWLQARINVWNGAFFNALEKKANEEIGPLLWQFAGYVAAAGLLLLVTVLVRMYLQIRLRTWVSQQLYSHWVDSRAFLQLDRKTAGAETPEFRMADDVRLAIDWMLDLVVGFLGSVVLAITFFEVLARVGGAISLPGSGVTIPAYFLVGAILYAVCMSGFASLLGWPLVGRIQRKNHLEGEFRYEIMRVRENAEAIATEQRERQAKHGLGVSLDELMAGWRRVMVAQARVMGVASSNAVLVGIFPVILAIPKYMSGEMKLGDVMQLATAFVQVQMALNWIVDNFVRFAELRASANRVGELVLAIDDLEQPAGAETELAPSGRPSAVLSSAKPTG